jgi:hypothetical protein
LRDAVALFDALSAQPLQPAHELATDAVRRNIDEQFARDVLKLPAAIAGPGGPLELLRNKLSAEPSIRGQK